MTASNPQDGKQENDLCGMESRTQLLQGTALGDDICLDEHDEPNPMDAAEEAPPPQQEKQRRRRDKEKRTSKTAITQVVDSTFNIWNDTGRGHLPLQVENDIADLGTFMGLIQPQDIVQAHPFSPTLEEYAVDGVPVD